MYTCNKNIKTYQGVISTKFRSEVTTERRETAISFLFKLGGWYKVVH